MLLSDLTAPARRLALVGLAKNTGKTVALNALLSELRGAGRTVGVTSVGRDGEEHDVIDFRIDKPRVQLAGGSLVATTDSLLRASGVPHETLSRTGVRTPLGEVLVARLNGAGGIVEIAGPSAAADVRAVGEEMLELGAEQVLIDGAIDRRAASSPRVSDGLVMSTGAVLSDEIEQVVARTRDAVALVRLPALSDDGSQSARELLGLAERAKAGVSMLVEEAPDGADDGPAAGANLATGADLAPDAGLATGTGLATGAHADGERLEPFELPPRFALTADEQAVAKLLGERPRARWLIVAGAVPEPFLLALATCARRARRALTVVAGDPTHLFLSERGVDFYAMSGIELRVLRGIELLALTVNPVAPQSHSFESGRLRGLLAQAIEGLPIFDVAHPEYSRDGAMARL